MAREVIATPLFLRNLKTFVDEYVELGAVRFVDRLRQSYDTMVRNIARHNAIGPARRRVIKDKRVTVREYVLNAGSRDFLVLYHLPDDREEPALLLNIRIGGQNNFQWK
jgi:hypothetical protein